MSPATVCVREAELREHLSKQTVLFFHGLCSVGLEIMKKVYRLRSEEVKISGHEKPQCEAIIEDRGCKGEHSM